MKIKKDMTALITGGSSGIGLEYARQLAAKGCKLFLISNREEELEAAKSELQEQYSVEILTKYQNLAAQDAAEELYKYCQDNNIIPDIVVCNAGMFFFKGLETEDLGKAATMVNLHVLTNTKLAILFGDDMKKRRSGIIILMSSLAAKLPVPGIAVYSASKAYLRNLGKALWYELRPFGVSITTVCPGAVATPLYGLKPSLMKFGVNIGVIKTTKWLVSRALKAAQRNRRCIEPSAMNYYLPVMLKMLPAHTEKRLWVKFGR